MRAEVNATWINVSVGLGRSPVKVRGLIANANGNINQIETRDGAVLTNPFSFADVYHRFADSWRVPANESLLSVCGDGEIERGIPKRPFYANDFDPQVYQRTREVCMAAGVKAGPLLDACTLDVAVIGDDQAATVFVGAPDPIAVGRITNAMTIKSKANSSFCMGVKHEVSEGANVQLFNCSDSDVHKDWNIMTSERSICQMGDNGALYCIDFRSGAVDAIVRQEDARKDNQRWLYDPQDQKFHGNDPSMCLDVENQSPNSQVKVTKCEDRKQFQQWEIQ